MIERRNGFGDAIGTATVSVALENGEAGIAARIKGRPERSRSQGVGARHRLPSNSDDLERRPGQ
ncbi:hypothetical protein SAMN05444161_2221 [Rhizobiales bacterium GAS191]|jgi:hypothetical protein|nr:hypothetical protein SAMN05519103_01334 [Rhizobiales bacterium GAS113]SEC96976.1 hypothetical protein SAMN05444161_2221 [Rhizobiales bacterium GAS191]